MENMYLNCFTSTVKENWIHDLFHTCSTFCNGWSAYIFGRTYFVAAFSCGLVEITYVSATVQILENVLWLNWGYFLSIFTGNQNMTSLLAIQQWMWNPPRSNTANSYFFIQNLICWSRRYTQASSYLTSCHSCINRQQSIYLVSYLRGNNTCKPASARCTVNRLHSRLKAFNPPGNSWIHASTMPISGTISFNIALALISS